MSSASPTSTGLADLNGAGFNITAADLKPVRLSIDIRAQHALRDELFKGIEKFKAKAGAGMILDVNTGEVVALASLPDYDPNNPVDALAPDRINRIMVGVYEMGSTFKAFTVAIGLDTGVANPSSTFDARVPYQLGYRTIKDYHAARKILTLVEVFQHSSNIGTAKLAESVGAERLSKYFTALGLTKPARVELMESARPLTPRKWDMDAPWLSRKR